MNWVTIGIGVLAVGYGLWTAFARGRSPKSFKKLEPMKKLWGERGGYWVHVVGYTIVPIAFGAVAIYVGVNDGSLP